MNMHGQLIINKKRRTNRSVSFFFTANSNFGKVLITNHLHKNKSSNYNRLKYSKQ